MAMITSAPSGVAEQRQVLIELNNLQKSMFDQSANHSKLILGLGYVGFFASWSGCKAYLRPWELLGSALLVSLSLFTYLIFEIIQAGFLSRAAIDFARAAGTPGFEVSGLRQYQSRTAKAQERYFKSWVWIYWFSVVTGLAGASILLAAFVHSLYRMLHS